MNSPQLALPRKPRNYPAIAAATLVFVITAITLSPGIGVDADFSSIANDWQQGLERIASMLTPQWSFFPETVQPIIETLAMAIIATVLGSAISLPLAFLTARTTNPNRVLRWTFRIIVNVVRSMPELLYAAILVAMVGVGALPGILALVLFNIGIMAKLVSEAIESNSTGPLEAGRAAGGTSVQVARTMALPDVWPQFLSQALFTFEINVRASSVLGLVGAGGIGLLIDSVRTYYQYDKLSLIILEILVIVVVLESVSAWLRKKVS
ncbi:phosphonate ABC transporter, permease protein PhnE [Corynebacterium otitidis]